MKIREEFDLWIFDCMYVRYIYTYKNVHIYVRIFVCMQLLVLVLVRTSMYVTYAHTYLYELRWKS